MFNEEVAANFEREEIDGTTLQSERIKTDESMNSLGLTTIGKKNKFVVAVQTLFGKYFWEKKLLYISMCRVLMKHPVPIVPFSARLF